MKIKSSLLFCTLLLALTGCGEPTGENQLVAISINTEPTKKEYTEGEFLDPKGLIIDAIRTNDTIQVAYEGNEDKFTFSPSLNTELTLKDTTVTITYQEKIAFWNITVNLAVKSFIADFTTKHEKVDNIPSTGNTDNNTNFMNTLNKYYLTNENVAISAFSGAYAQITGDSKGHQVTETRNKPQVLILGGKKQVADLTFTFATTIKSVTFVCEAYSKYDTYNKVQNIDYDTYLTVNDDKKDISAHKEEDIDETANLKYVVNSTSIHIEVPNTNTGGSEDKKGNRILVYQMVFEY